MSTITPVLAEVADKEFTLLTLWIVALILCAAGFFLSHWHRWAAFVSLPVAFVWAYAIVSELRDRFVGPAIYQELGLGYVVQSYLSAALPFLFIVLGFLRSKPNTT